MNAATLEQRYRRLLACYPAQHRRTYGEEMIGVLLASAPAGKRRPDIADTLDLFGGAVRVRLRSTLTGTPDPGWRNALALTGLLGLRRIAAVGAAATVPWFAVQAATAGGRPAEPRLAAYLVLIAIEAVALAISPGPRHALRLITPRAILLGVPWILTAAYTGGLVATSYPVPQVAMRLAIVDIALAGLPALAKATARRLLVLLVAIPGSAFAVSLLSFANVDFYSMSFIAAMFGP